MTLALFIVLLIATVLWALSVVVCAALDEDVDRRLDAWRHQPERQDSQR